MLADRIYRASFTDGVQNGDLFKNIASNLPTTLGCLLAVINPFACIVAVQRQLIGIRVGIY